MFCIDLLEKYRVLRSFFVVLFKFPKQNCWTDTDIHVQWTFR